MPVAAPGILAAGLLGFILSWNEFLFALILSGKRTQTLPVGLSALETHRGVEIALLAAATLFAVLPVLSSAAVSAQIPDQGPVARRPEVNASTRPGERHDEQAADAWRRRMALVAGPAQAETINILMESVPDTRFVQEVLPEFTAADRHRRRARGRQLRRDAHQAGAAAGGADRQLRRHRGRLLLGRRVHQGRLAAAAGRADRGGRLRHLGLLPIADEPGRQGRRRDLHAALLQLRHGPDLPEGHARRSRGAGGVQGEVRHRAARARDLGRVS